ncbi:hypothetical protein M378DRAFT_183754 [Amanita muscaria Koide BX008]|uniref:SWR1-complex protein 4 n=1 Tax=Amanita muscaria (strain Koide BX008) TaxID=946122 RepID=A0A0C2X771_AMAMK|nr:hypothetical protein M378DRAFT_183754 [Amanita muscaria Koide BX008]
MAATAADIRSALSLKEIHSAPQPKKSSSFTTKKPEGISRELYSLIGPSAPTLAAQLAKPRLKQRPNLGTAGKARWEYRSFKNPGRTDGLELRHWVKASNDANAEYPFAKYNVRPASYAYSEEEYTKFLEDSEWTKAETDHLFALVEEYDTRWYVVYDRYDFPGSERSIEDLKDRYYSVSRKLIRNQPWDGDENAKTQLLASFQFDKERELTRKKYLRSLDNRTPEQIAEEEALYVEIRRLEQNERKFKKERDELLRTLAGIESGLPDIVEDEMPVAFATDTKKKKKGGIMDLDSPLTPSSISLGPPIVKRAQTAKSAAYDAQHCIVRTDLLQTTTNTKSAHTPAYLRSFKLPIPKQAIAPKVTQALAELGILHTRLVMPTRDNCAQLEQLVEATTTLIDTKRMVDKVDYDIKVLKTRLGLREGQGDEEEEAGNHGLGPSEAGMEVDGENEPEEVVGDDRRSQSVVSTRSRKHSRRSMSISSIDTAANVSTRAVMKRQKRS